MPRQTLAPRTITVALTLAIVAGCASAQHGEEPTMSEAATTTFDLGSQVAPATRLLRSYEHALNAC
ncbi:MAG: hypothetical protein H6698_09095 [Myxococcales bacterium]|nr:hypothetical protein [Myxococcales bacterium]